MIQVIPCEDEKDLATRAARLLAHELLKPMLPGEKRALMLSGGSTPLAAYRQVEAMEVVCAPGQWFFLSDERRVPFDSKKNNFRNIEGLFAGMGCPPERCLRVQTALHAADAAAAYHDALSGFLAGGGTLPVGLLGLGADGHTASLFSDADLQRGEGHLATWVTRPDGMEGISVTPELLAKVGRLIFLVAGAGKRDMARRLIENPPVIPAAQAVRNCPCVELWVDRAAHP